MSLPFGWQSVRLDPSANERIRNVVGSSRPLEPGAAPEEGAFLHLVASTEAGQSVVTEGTVVRVLEADRLVAELTFVEDESLRDAYPMLVHLERASAATEWTLAHFERLFSDAAVDVAFEDVRTAVVRERHAYLRNKTERPLSRIESLMTTAADRAGWQETLERIRVWHRATGRAWPLDPA
jgi:hypothetical protein